MKSLRSTRVAWPYGCAIVVALVVPALTPAPAAAQSTPNAAFLANLPEDEPTREAAGPSQSRQPFDHAYVVATFSCGQSGKEVAVFSQVFGACYLETGHSRIASDQRSTFAEVAKAACGGDARFMSQRASYPRPGPNGQGRAEEERDTDMLEVARYRHKVETAYIQEPYSSRCQ